MSALKLELLALAGFPEVRAGDNLAALILAAMDSAQLGFQPGDILTVAQKIVSKAEGRTRCLADIIPTDRALEIAQQCQKDPRKVQAILDETQRPAEVQPFPSPACGRGAGERAAIVRCAPGVLIVRHRQGWVCANAGIDESNLGSEGELLLLPENPDNSARQIAGGIEQASGIRPGVVITDSFGRPWRRGLVNIALGTAEVPVIIDWIGKTDAYGRELAVTQQALCDEIAAASGLLSLKNAALPVCLLRGLDWQPQNDSSAKELIRPLQEDLFQ